MTDVDWTAEELHNRAAEARAIAYHDTLAYLTETEPARILRAAARIADHIHNEHDTRPHALRALANQLEGGTGD